MAIKIGDKVRLKDITEEEAWSVYIGVDIWNKYKNSTFTVVKRPTHKSPPSIWLHGEDQITYIETISSRNTPLCWWVYEKFVTPVQRQLTFIFHD
jgi:hypothetical protein